MFLLRERVENYYYSQGTAKDVDFPPSPNSVREAELQVSREDWGGP